MKSRVSFLALYLMLLVLAAAYPCFAAGQPVLLQSELQQPDKIWVGQRLDLNVTLFTTSSFVGVPRFDLPNDAGLVMFADDAHPLLGTKTIDGASYISKQYTVSLFPLRSGSFTVPSFSVEFGYEGEAGQDLDATLSSAAARISVLDVPGADRNLPLVTATDFTIDDRWDPSPDKAAVGDAFTRTITMRANGLPGMAMPPLLMRSIDGLAIYPNQPQVGTDTARGNFIGKRVETISLVCQHAGTYTLPEMRVQWWNPVREELRELKLPPLTLQVAPNSMLEPSTVEGAAGFPYARSPWLRAVALTIFVLALAGGVWLLRIKREQSGLVDKNNEKILFQLFKQTAASHEAAGTMQALFQWFDAAGRQKDIHSVREFIKRYGEADLERQFTALEACLYSQHKESWSGEILSKEFAAARKRCLRSHAEKNRREALGPLNP